MDYDTIIIGATFAAAGILESVAENCFVLERRPQAGYEFLNALKFGSFDKEPKSDKGKAFLNKLMDKGIFNEYGVKFFDAASTFYSYLSGKNVLLNMEIMSIEKNSIGFTVTCCGVSGIRKFTAANVIDTTPEKDNIKERSLNFLVVPENKDGNPFLGFDGMKAYMCGLKSGRICRLALDDDDDYISARKKLYDLTLKEEFKGYRLEFTADTFDIAAKSCKVSKKDGITYLTSCAFDNAVDAFDAGVVFGEGRKA